MSRLFAAGLLIGGLWCAKPSREMLIRHIQARCYHEMIKDKDLDTIDMNEFTSMENSIVYLMHIETYDWGVFQTATIQHITEGEETCRISKYLVSAWRELKNFNLCSF